MIVLARRKVPSTHTDFRAHRRGMNRESFPITLLLLIVNVMYCSTLVLEN